MYTPLRNVSFRSLNFEILAASQARATTAAPMQTDRNAQHQISRASSRLQNHRHESPPTEVAIAQESWLTPVEIMGVKCAVLQARPSPTLPNRECLKVVLYVAAESQNSRHHYSSSPLHRRIMHCRPQRIKKETSLDRAGRIFMARCAR